MSSSGLVFGLVSATLAVIVGRATGMGWTAAIGLAVLLGTGIYLWARDETKGWGDLGQGIVVSVVVAISLMAVQRDADTRRERSAERQSLQLTLTMRNDLRGIGLAGRDMHGFFLAEKRLDGANLERANLTEADLGAASLTGANLAGAKLDKARLVAADLTNADFEPHQDRDEPTEGAASLRGADLEEARLQDANLSHADLTGAVLVNARLRDAHLSGARLRGAALIYADLRDSHLEDADLGGSRLGGATFCAAELRGVRLNGALYDDSTRWPPGFDASRHGARRTARFSNAGPEADLASQYELPDGSGGGLQQRAYASC